eukprot:2878357-Rhodomonas_salina.1
MHGTDTAITWGQHQEHADCGPGTRYLPTGANLMRERGRLLPEILRTAYAVFSSKIGVAATTMGGTETGRGMWLAVAGMEAVGTEMGSVAVWSTATGYGGGMQCWCGILREGVAGPGEPVPTEQSLETAKRVKVR